MAYHRGAVHQCMLRTEDRSCVLLERLRARGGNARVTSAVAAAARQTTDLHTPTAKVKQVLVWQSQ